MTATVMVGTGSAAAVFVAMVMLSAVGLLAAFVSWAIGTERKKVVWAVVLAVLIAIVIVGTAKADDFVCLAGSIWLC